MSIEEEVLEFANTITSSDNPLDNLASLLGLDRKQNWLGVDDETDEEFRKRVFKARGEMRI